MYFNETLLVGRGSRDAALLPKMANRHGLIAGATGTGKTVTLKVLAESFSDAGVPVFLADVKGDLSGMIEGGSLNPKIDERLKELDIRDFSFHSYPTVFWDIFGSNGLPVRTTISEMGPLLLSRLLDLNETQTSILTVIFRIADDRQLLLLDYKDLKEMVQYVSSNSSSLKDEYGNLPGSSISAIFRKIIAFEEEGADLFFGEEALDIRDFMRTDANSRGNINILDARKLYHSPKMYSTFLLWMISELFEELPEAGDLDKPKLVFFFDEAHLLFNNAPKVLLDKIEQVVRLIRSKGVGIYFISQNPDDIAEDVLGQLGNKVQHALRSFTPKDQKAIKAAARSFRNDGNIDIVSQITSLKVGQALVSFLDADGAPGEVDIVTILPPSSKMGPADPSLIASNLSAEPLASKYRNPIDRESAYEVLRQRSLREEEDKIRRKQQEEWEKQRAKEEAAFQKEKEKWEREMYQKTTKTSRSKSSDTFLETSMKQMTRSISGTIGRQIGKELIRGIFGSLKR
ncbi:MAG: DUF853 family protein [Filifactor alocis]|nr:DUF853 family protein [Filifactor alocis]